MPLDYLHPLLLLVLLLSSSERISACPAYVNSVATSTSLDHLLPARPHLRSVALHCDYENNRKLVKLVVSLFSCYMVKLFLLLLLLS